MTGRVLVAGGGTGGHVVPSLAVAEVLRDDGLDVAFLGTAEGIEARMVPEAGFPLAVVEARPLPRRPSLDALRAVAALWRGHRLAARMLAEPEVVAALVFGGYVSGPLALAARRTRVPLVVHEQNAVPGRANRLAARLATRVAATYEESVAALGGPARVSVTGNPVRPGLVGLDLAALRREGLAAFDLEPGRRTLLAFGGSLGAQSINEALVASAARWPAPDQVQILHVTGTRGHDAACAAWETALTAAGAAPRVRVVAFVERMDLAYAAADVVLCRSGATTVAELCVLGLPAVLVPFPHALADEQTANARALVAAGGGVLVADRDLDGATLVGRAWELLGDEGARVTAGAAARRLGRPDAARRVATLVHEAAATGAKGRAHTGHQASAVHR